MKKSNESNTPDFCTCKFCTARYFTTDLLQTGLDSAKNENDMVHFIFNPIARITIPRWRWRDETDLFDDATATAVGNLFVYSRTHVLQGTERCLRTLIKVARAGVAYVLREYQRHEAPWVDPRELDDKAKTRLIGRRLYGSSRLGDEECTDPLTKILDEDAARHPDAVENDIVKRTDAKTVISAFFKPSNSPKKIRAGLENAAYYFGIISKAQADLMSTKCFLEELYQELQPLTRIAEIPKENIVLCFQRARNMYGSEIDLQKMLTRVYNRRRIKNLDHTISL